MNLINQNEFDSYGAFKEFENAGVEEKHAELIVKYISMSLHKREEQLRGFATQDSLEVTKLTLQKEIEEVRSEIKRVELSLQKEIEEVRSEIKRVELFLQKEIEEVRSEIKRVELSLQKEIVKASSRTIYWVAGFLFANTGLIVTLLKLL